MTWLKHHTNTWGLSSNNWLADEIVSNMVNVHKFDLSDTAKYQHRTDLCLGIRSILLSSIDKNVQQIDLSNNFLDVDGARAFASFLEENTTLEHLKINNCSLG